MKRALSALLSLIPSQPYKALCPTAGFFLAVGSKIKSVSSKKKGGVNMSSLTKIINGKLCRLVCRRYIRVNGKVVYPKRSKAFCFWVED